MRNNEFLSTLNSLLSRVPEKERHEMLYDYQEHFEIGANDGKSEKELAGELGDPHVIARELLADYFISKAESDQTATNMFRAIFAAVSLSFFNIIFIAGPVAALLGTYLALCAAAILLTLSPFGIMASSFMGFSIENFAFNFFFSLTLVSLGLLMSIGMIYVGKYFYHLILRYIKFNLRIVKGDRAV